MVSPKVARHYRRARQSALATFAESVLNRTQSNPAYQTLQPQVETLAVSLTTYRNALAAAQNHGRAEISAKNLARTDLRRRLHALAGALETLAADDPQLIFDAGFSTKQSTTVRLLQLPKPSILRAFSTGKKGEIRVQVEDETPGSTLLYALEYSLSRDGGWQNGAYHNHLQFTVGDLPRADELWIRIRCLGRKGLKSEWSEPMSVSVL